MSGTMNLKERILALVADVSDPLTAEVVGQAISDVPTEEVLSSLEALVDEGTLDYDLFGFRLAKRPARSSKTAKKARPRRPAGEPTAAGSGSGSVAAGSSVPDTRRIFFQDEEMAVLGLGQGTERLLREVGITTVRDLVSWLGAATDAGPALSGTLDEVRASLTRRSIATPDTLDDVEVLALCDVSASFEFAFDLFGRLCSVAGRICEMGVGRKGVTALVDGARQNVLRVPDAATTGARQVLADLQSKEIPVFPEAYVVCMAHAVVRRMGAGSSVSEYADAVLGMTEGSQDAADACAGWLMRLLAQKGPGGTCAVPDGMIWDEAARLVEEADARYSFDGTSRTLGPVRPKVLAWLETADLDGRDRTLTRNYLQGLSFEQCGASWSLTPERVRQDVHQVLVRAPEVEEDRHRYLFETYGLTKAEFLDVTGEDVCAYAYLRATAGKVGGAPLADAAEDARLDEHVRMSIRRLLGLGEPSGLAADLVAEDDVKGELRMVEEGSADSSAVVPMREGRPKAQEGFHTYRENQRGISYEMLFGPYFEGASQIRIVDPYVRAFHQCRNIMELMAVLVRHRDFTKPAPKVHLVTGRSDGEALKQREFLRRIELALAAQDIVFTWECDLGRTIHARHVYVDDEWDIQLDRGLDFWQKFDSGDAFTFEALIPETRRVRQFEITYRRLDKVAIA